MKVETKKTLRVLLLVCLILALCVGGVYAVSSIFADSKDQKAEQAINTLVEQGALGYPAELVAPDEIITRAEFAALMARTLKLPVPDKKDVAFQFADLGGNWAQTDVDALIVAGIIQKDDFGTMFMPKQPITRLEIIRMLLRAIGKGDGFEDVSEDGIDNPNDNATRCEAFEMLKNANKPKAQAKKDGEIKPEDKPSNPNRNGGSTYVPSPQFSFMLPKTAYTSEEIKIQPESRYVSDVIWTVLKNGLPAILPEVLDGTLSLQGGAVKFKDTGSFTLIATAQNSRGVTVTYEQSISIYHVVTASFTLPETTHTDTMVAVDLITENLGSKDVVWSISKNDEPVSLFDALNGDLTAAGGIIQVKSQGEYALTASITDELGKIVTVSATTTVYPVAEIKLSLPSITHTDKTITLSTTAKETDGLSLIFTLSKNGEPVEIADFIDGNLADGSIRFKDKGVYALTASVTDTTGRVFSDTADITVYPVGSAGFYLPEIFHTDMTITVEAVFREIGQRTARWSLTKDGVEMSLADAAEGTLGNSGGSLRIKEKGSYTLNAEFTDDGGRIYRYEQRFVVYPVPTFSYSLPRYAHTDCDITIRTEDTDLDGIIVEWLVDNTFGFQDWPTFVSGKLTNNGGIIRFKRAGLYELVARITDETGRVFLYESNDRCEVLPVLTIGFELPSYAYTDTAIDLRTHGNNNVLPVVWSISKNSENVPLSEAFSGKLTSHGGKIIFRSDGKYILTATMTDYLQRSYSHSESISILPVVQYAFTMPQTIHYGAEFAVSAKDVLHIGSYSVVWTLQKDGNVASYQGTLGNDGGRIAIRGTGNFTLTASVTDSAGRVAAHSESIDITNTEPNSPSLTIEQTRTVLDGKFLVNLSANATDPDGDTITLEWEGAAADNHYAVGTHTVMVRAKDIAGAYSQWTEKTFTIVSVAPTVTLTAEPTRTVNNGKFLVNISAVAADADGDPTTLEWENKAADSYYPAGTHTIRVRAKDSTGLYSAWVSKTFTIINSAPSTPVISRTPSGNSVPPGTPITITATSSDPEGDPITLVWENRSSQTQTYPLGRNLVRVKAVDAAGQESPWAAIVFFVADATNGGGMTLIGPDSVILENGLEGATITEYTFTVPPVDGHVGSDFGRVRGYNVQTGQWVQLDYGTTTNGITFRRTLNPGVYSKLEFYYYTNHNCMYGKSNITYSVTYYFE